MFENTGNGVKDEANADTSDTKSCLYSEREKNKKALYRWSDQKNRI